MKDTDGYAVYFFPQALEALGEAVKPYLTESPHGTHVVCTVIDTAGSLIQMSLEGTTAGGQVLQVQLMVPSSMVRMIVSARGDEAFGFKPRARPASVAAPETLPAGGEAASTAPSGADAASPA